MCYGSDALPRLYFGALIFLAGLTIPPTQVHAEPLMFHASQSGKQTLDAGEGGGNPFASALIEILGRPSGTLADLRNGMKQLTFEKSRGFQEADVPAALPDKTWSLAPIRTGEKRIALVLVVSDYTNSGGAASLPGARRDAQRIAAAFERAGFTTSVALDLALPGLRRTLSAFANQSENSDASIIYTTGHGIESAGKIYLLAGNYPVGLQQTAVATHALPLAEIAGSLRAKQVNLLFYGGCRDNPFSNQR